MPANLENSAVSTGLEKVSFHSNLKEKQYPKYFKLGCDSRWTENFQMFKLDLEKAVEPEIKLPTSVGSLKKQESSRKNIYFCFMITPKPLIAWITTNSGKFLKRREYQNT